MFNYSYVSAQSDASWEVVHVAGVWQALAFPYWDPNVSDVTYVQMC